MSSKYLSRTATPEHREIESPPPSPPLPLSKAASNRHIGEIVENYNESSILINNVHNNGASTAPSTESPVKLNYAPVWKSGFQNRRNQSSSHLKSVFPAGFQMSTVRTTFLGEGEPNFRSSKPRNNSLIASQTHNQSHVNSISFTDWTKGGSMLESVMSDEDDEASDPYADYAGPLLSEINRARVTSALKLNGSISENSACKARKCKLLPKPSHNLNSLPQQSQNTLSTSSIRPTVKVFHAPTSLPSLPNVLQNQRVHQLIRPPSPHHYHQFSSSGNDNGNGSGGQAMSAEYVEWISAQRNHQNEEVWRIKGNNPSVNYSAYQFDGSDLAAGSSLLPPQDRHRVIQSLPLHIAAAVYVEIRTLNQFLSSVTVADQFLLVPQPNFGNNTTAASITPLQSAQTTGRESVSVLSAASQASRGKSGLSHGSVLSEGSGSVGPSNVIIPTAPLYSSPTGSPCPLEKQLSIAHSVISVTSAATHTSQTTSTTLLHPPYPTPPVRTLPPNPNAPSNNTNNNSVFSATTSLAQQLYLQLSPDTTFHQLQDHVLQHVVQHIEASLPSLPLTSIYTAEYLTKINQKYYVTQNAIKFGLNLASLDQLHLLIYYYHFASQHWKLVASEEDFTQLKFYATMTLGTQVVTSSSTGGAPSVEYRISPEHPLPMMYTMDDKTERFLVGQIKEKYELRKFLFEQDHPVLSIEALTEALDRDALRKRKKKKIPVLPGTLSSPASRGSLLASLTDLRSPSTIQLGKTTLSSQSTSNLQQATEDPKLTAKYLQHLKIKHEKEHEEKIKQATKNSPEKAPLLSLGKSILYPKTSKTLQQLQEYSAHSVPKLELYANNLEQKILKTKW